MIHSCLVCVCVIFYIYAACMFIPQDTLPICTRFLDLRAFEHSCPSHTLVLICKDVVCSKSDEGND